MFAERPSHTILKADGKFEMVEDFCTHVWPGNPFIGVSRFLRCQNPNIRHPIF